MSPLRCARTFGLLALLSLGACTTEPEVHTCEVQEDCPASTFCLQQVCETTPLPSVHINNPEDEIPYPWKNDGTAHTVMLDIVASNLTLRPLAESSERVVGEGHLVVFVDEVEVATIESGDVQGGVQMEITVEDTPGAHRLRVQARLNDGSDYDNEDGSARNIMWVDDGLQHVALREPWPGDEFSLEAQTFNAEIAVLGDEIAIGPPTSGLQHVNVYVDADEPFEDCIVEPTCFFDYEGIVPADDDPFGPVYMPESAAGPATLTVVVMNSDHTLYTYMDEMGMERSVYSSIQIERTDEVMTPSNP